MQAVNVKRVLLGGLLAGLVINVGEFLLNGVILADYYVQLTERHALPQMGGAVLGAFVVLGFAVGMVGVWLYAAARPRLGPGVATALKIAAAVWFLSYVMPTAGIWGMGLMDGGTAGLCLVWGLVEMGLGITAGAAVYTE